MINERLSPAEYEFELGSLNAGANGNTRPIDSPADLTQSGSGWFFLHALHVPAYGVYPQTVVGVYARKRRTDG